MESILVEFLVSVEAIVGVLVMERRVRLVHQVLLDLLQLLPLHLLQLVNADLSMDSSLSHLIKLGLHLELPRLVLHLFELLLPPQLFIELNLLLLSNLFRVHMDHLLILQKLQVLLPMLVLLVLMHLL